MGDRAAFILTLDPLWNNKEWVARYLESNAVEHHWVTPWVAVGCMKQYHDDFGETFREWEQTLRAGATLTIVDESGHSCWTNCHGQFDERFDTD